MFLPVTSKNLIFLKWISKVKNDNQNCQIGQKAKLSVDCMHTFFVYSGER